MAEIITTLAQTVNAEAVYQIFYYSASFITLVFFVVLTIYLINRLVSSTSKGKADV